MLTSGEGLVDDVEVYREQNKMSSNRPNQNLLKITQEQNGILRLKLNDPNRLNALSEAMLNDLVTAVDKISIDPEVRAVILASTGTVFCAGHDLKEITAARKNTDMGRAYFVKILSPLFGFDAKNCQLPETNNSRS